VIISVRHNFETAHRLPFLGGKCTNLHGHSWWVTWSFDIPMDPNGLTTDYGTLKSSLRGWVDKYLDHGVMLGLDDALVDYFKEFEPVQKMFVFGTDQVFRPWPTGPWPTVEAVAELLASVAHLAVGYRPFEVVVQETHVNSATWRR
jgi:6-pyruvoyltetrahydropterin/6-carboxytetrahydropterin synthase